jgi:hypothetical protein
MYVIEEQSDLGILYIGHTPAFDQLTTKPQWQIKRITYDGDIITNLYANDAKYNCVWDNRATYFPFVAPSGIPVPNTTGTVTGVFTPSGLNIGGKVTVQAINNLTWTQLPAVALPNRNAMSVINRSGQDAVLNYDPLTVGFVGVPLDNGGERNYDITDAIPIYGKSQLSACNLIIEELA